MSTNTEPVKQKHSALSRIINVIGMVVCVLLIPVMIVLGTLLVKATLYPNRPPDFMGYVPLVVGSDSMAPDVEGKDLLIVSIPDDPAALGEGTIISYMNGSVVVTHRIVDAVTDEGGVTYITQGDANVADGGTVFPEQIVGVYLARLDGIGDYVLFMQTPMGIMLIVVLPILLICFTLYALDLLRYRQVLKAQHTAQTTNVVADAAVVPEASIVKNTGTEAI